MRDGGQIKYIESQSQNPETQGSQIDSAFYQQLLYQNTLEEAALAKYKLQ